MASSVNGKAGRTVGDAQDLKYAKNAFTDVNPFAGKFDEFHDIL